MLTVKTGIVIDDVVYNVTEFASEHPGGAMPLMNLAGTSCSCKSRNRRLQLLLIYIQGNSTRYIAKQALKHTEVNSVLEEQVRCLISIKSQRMIFSISPGNRIISKTVQVHRHHFINWRT